MSGERPGDDLGENELQIGAVFQFHQPTLCCRQPQPWSCTSWIDASHTVLSEVVSEFPGDLRPGFGVPLTIIRSGSDVAQLVGDSLTPSTVSGP